MEDDFGREDAAAAEEAASKEIAAAGSIPESEASFSLGDTGLEVGGLGGRPRGRFTPAVTESPLSSFVS